MLNYYSNLLYKKISNKIHDKLEKKYFLQLPQEIEEFQFFLIKRLFENLKNENNGLYVDTKIKNLQKPLILSQARMLLTFVSKYKEGNSKLSLWIIKKIVSYIKNERNLDKYYTFNYPSWDKQDEGIATVWALIALLKANEILNDSDLLDFIEETANVMIDEFYNVESSLVHTKGDNFWCLNAASTLAWFLSDLLQYKYDKRFEDALNNSISVCLDNQSTDGFFPYSEIRKGTYLLLYNPIVVYTLDKCKKSHYLDLNLRDLLDEKLNEAREFILSQMDDNNYFVEPEVTKYSRYIISNITSLVALKGYIDKNLEEKILENVASFMKNGELFLCINDNYKLYNGSLFKLKDQLSIETLYWLQVYLS